MPRCQFRIPAQGKQENATFPTPKRVADTEAWLVAATKALGGSDDMPTTVYLGRVQRVNGWTESSRHVSDNFVRFDFVDNDGRKCVIIIERRFQQLGARV